MMNLVLNNLLNIHYCHLQHDMINTKLTSKNIFGQGREISRPVTQLLKKKLNLRCLLFLQQYILGVTVKNSIEKVNTLGR